MGSSSQDSSCNCIWMSIDISIKNVKLPVWSDFPNLRLLKIRNFSEGFDANFVYFRGINELNVLCFLGLTDRSFPPSLKLLEKLRTLHLECCQVTDISLVGELASLEILIVRYCHKFKELPVHVGRLNHLRVLELERCNSLKRIAPGVISSLVGLEELKIINCFHEWEPKENQSEERNACLSELESLPSLTCLEIEISNCNLFAEEIHLSQQLVRYQIRSHDRVQIRYREMKHERRIALTLQGDVTVGNCIHRLLRSTQSLVLHGDGSTLKNVVNSTDFKFLELEYLELRHLEKLEEIICGTIPEDSNSFQNRRNVSGGNLKSVNIFKCPNLRYVLSAATARSLVRLERLQIIACDTTEHVLWNEIESNRDASIMELPALKELILDGLPNLTTFSHGVEIIECPQLTILRIENCPKLKTKIGKCPNLRKIRLNRFNGVDHLLSSCVITTQLERIEIIACDTTEHVLWNEIESNRDASIMELPALQELILDGLPNLTTFSHGVEIIECPQLTTLRIENCPKLKTKTVTSTQLKRIQILDCDTIEEILWDEVEDVGNRHIIFPELCALQLHNLPCLTTFYRGVESIKFPELIYLTIGNLAKMNSLLAPMDSEPTHDDHSLHFFCNQKVEFPSLRSLYLHNLHDIRSNIWCHNIPTGFFRNLCSLDIFSVDGIRNLMSSSMAKNLVNLSRLEIVSCPNMVAVIEDEKEVPAAASLFPKLENLLLLMLHKLRSFYEWKHALELPLLHCVGISDCPRMEAFTLGSLSTPNLSKFKISFINVEITDLNTGIHDHFMATRPEGTGNWSSRLRTGNWSSRLRTRKRKRT